jgi:hypothetical protein
MGRPPAFDPGYVLACSAVLCQPLQGAPRPQLSLPFRARPSNGGSSPCTAWLRCRCARLTACARKGLPKAGRGAGTAALNRTQELLPKKKEQPPGWRLTAAVTVRARYPSAVYTSVKLASAVSENVRYLGINHVLEVYAFALLDLRRRLRLLLLSHRPWNLLHRHLVPYPNLPQHG